MLCLFDSVLAGVFSCGPLFVTHVSLFTVFRDFGAEFGYLARRWNKGTHVMCSNRVLHLTSPPRWEER